MSATLTWYNSGLGTKTGTTIAALIADLVTLVNSKAGDANFSWQVASSNSAATPYYLVLKRKDASAGRILIVSWSSAPAGNNAAILDGAPLTTSFYGAWFPNGNVDSPSNLTASSGTILGNDTDCVKVWSALALSTAYAASIQPFYFDCAEAVFFGFQNPSVAGLYGGAAGNILVDASDNAYGGVMSGGAQSLAGFGNGVLLWTATKPSASSNTPCIRTNYGSSDRVYNAAWTPSGPWASQAVGPNDVLTDTGAAKVWHVPVQLLGNTKGEGFPLKLRQIAFGPGTLGAFTPYNTTGPVVSARQFNAATAGGNGYPWLTNFKL